MSRPIRNWDQPVPELQMSPYDFFDLVQQRLEAEATRKIHFSLAKHGSRREGARDYLRINYHRTDIRVGAAPYRGGLYLSYWVFRSEPRSTASGIYATLAKLVTRIPIPFVGPVYRYIFGRMSVSAQNKLDVVYTTDAAYMFQHRVHDCIKEIITEAVSTQGQREFFLSQPVTFTDAIS